MYRPNLKGKSLPVTTLTTPGSFEALRVSMRTMRAWACGLSTMQAWSRPGPNSRSSANLAAPVIFSQPSMRSTECPTTFVCKVGQTLSSVRPAMASMMGV